MEENIKINMSESNEEKQFEDVRTSEKYKKLMLIRKILFSTSLIVIWGVSATFNVLDLRNGVKYLSSPWSYLSLFTTLLLIFAILLPLQKSIRKDLDQYKKQKEIEEK